MKRYSKVLSVAAALLSAGPLSAQVTINFDALGNGTVVTNQYAAQGAVFSSSPGAVNYTTAQNLGTSTPNFICSGPANSGISCALPTYIDFSSSVGALSFYGVGINDRGTVAQARVYNGMSLIGTIDVQGAASPFTPVFVDFGATTGITRLEIDQITDAAGIGWDDFTYTVNPTSTVPEPATILLVAGGLVGLAAAARRRTA